MKPLHIPASVLSIFTPGAEACCQGTLIDPARKAVVAANSVICAVRPFPKDAMPFTKEVVIPHRNEPFDYHEGMADLPANEIPWGWETLVADPSPAYRIRLDARQLAILAAAMETDSVILELPAILNGESIVHVLHPSVLADGTRPYGFIQHEGGDGLLASTALSAIQKSPPVAKVELRFNPDKGGIELAFTDKPSDPVREGMKDKGFRWHGLSKVWYAKDTESRRTFACELLRKHGIIPPASMPPLPVKAA